MQSTSKLVTGEQLLEMLFDKESKPSIRWLKNHQKELGYTKIGHLVRFDPDLVRERLAKRAIKGTK